jgi:ceramide glucosyltransferase
MALAHPSLTLEPLAADVALLVLSLIAALWWCISCFVFVFSLIGALLQPYVQRRRATNQEQLPVSMILPIKLLNPGFEKSQRSAFRQTYPDYEILVSASERKSPALDVVQELIENFPHRQACILQSTSEVAASPKMNNLVAPLAAARHDLIVTKDSNITLDRDFLGDFVRNLAPGVGLVCAVPVAVRAEGLAAQIEAFLINGHARILLSVSMLGLGFGVGKVLLFRRSDLQKLGGVASVSDTIAEDSAISKGFMTLGLKTVFSHHAAKQEIGRRSLRDIYDRQCRWAVIRRAMEPVSFPLEIFYSPLWTALAAALAAPLFGESSLLLAGVTLVLWFAGEISVATLKGWDVSLWSPVAFMGREILSLSAWLRAWTTRDVVWANQSLDVFDGRKH